MKLIVFLIFFFTSNFCFSAEGKNFKKKLSVLKKQTVTIHNDILKNDDELKKIKIDIEKNKQRKIIFERYIKDKEDKIIGSGFKEFSYDGNLDETDPTSSDFIEDPNNL